MIDSENDLYCRLRPRVTVTDSESDLSSIKLRVRLELAARDAMARPLKDGKTWSLNPLRSS